MLPTSTLLDQVSSQLTDAKLETEMLGVASKAIIGCEERSTALLDKLALLVHRLGHHDYQQVVSMLRNMNLPVVLAPSKQFSHLHQPCILSERGALPNYSAIELFQQQGINPPLTFCASASTPVSDVQDVLAYLALNQI